MGSGKLDVWVGHTEVKPDLCNSSGVISMLLLSKPQVTSETEEWKKVGPSRVWAVTNAMEVVEAKRREDSRRK